jgi:ergothioneine biosynthesis protein EgtB
LDQYRRIRETTLALVAPLSAEDCAIQSMPDASPAKWHLAHTTWFFETFVLQLHVPGYRAFDPAYAYLFNSYYNAMGERHPRPERGMLSRPPLDEVLAYRRHVDEAILSIDEPGREALGLLELGVHHEQQHQELILTDVKHLLSRSPLKPAYQRNWPLTPIRAREAHWIEFPGGLYEIGHAGPGFGFDNETPRHRVWLEDFEMASHPVTHGDFLDFIADGGYRRPELWLSDGWALAQREGWDAPLYWLKDDDGRESAFTLSGVRPLDPHAPVEHLSFFEAAAYACWAGKRLATEFEWEAMSGSFAHGQVWEWTRSSYDPYPGFRPFDGVAAEYNGKFMVGQIVLRGGSVATPPGHIRPTYRNFFPPSARWQFSGIRLAEDA